MQSKCIEPKQLIDRHESRTVTVYLSPLSSLLEDKDLLAKHWKILSKIEKTSHASPVELMNEMIRL